MYNEFNLFTGLRNLLFLAMASVSEELSDKTRWFRASLATCLAFLAVRETRVI